MLFPLRDDNPHTSTPKITVLLIAACTAVWFYEVSLGHHLDAFVMEAGAIPDRLMGAAADPGTPAALPVWSTLITSLFLHGGWMHLIGNMWFLWIFGDNVEHRLGSLRFLGFYVLGGIAATFTHVASDPTSMIPVVGASGSISAVLGAYAVMYPRARVSTFVWLFVFIRRFELPAAAFLGLWFLGQFMNLGSAGVAWWAHIGGFVVGAVVGLMFRRPSAPVGGTRRIRRR